ncbi:rod shape-determining protein MreD [Aurantiacibacter luteus]|uniref:Rod shape-determining protein MreD n=1 Tax=Aurantiacibacter luteus TaxID=1581420 RepID=A0A0G9MYA7_9SPHN|nr:rod shape-determining protein MreD [Aurantiacibacter luteus]KLE35579.1 rod shape-determining protein MreD [Aurantiacibacter luteus]
MERLNASARRDQFGSKLNRDHSPVLAFGIPWLTIILASMVPLLPVIAPAPILPPLGYIALLAWRMARPGLLPLWAGVPLGLVDDLYSGQPFGCAIFLFSATMIAIELIEMRFPWRGFWQDWAVASAFIVAYIGLTALFSGAPLSANQLPLLLPQLGLSILLFPMIARLVTALDNLRLKRVRRFG